MAASSCARAPFTRAAAASVPAAQYHPQAASSATRKFSAARAIPARSAAALLPDPRRAQLPAIIGHPDQRTPVPAQIYSDNQLPGVLFALTAKARDVHRRLLQTMRAGQGCVLASPAIERVAQPTLTEGGRRAPALRFGETRVMALAGALSLTVSGSCGLTSKSLRALTGRLLGTPTPPAR